MAHSNRRDTRKPRREKRDKDALGPLEVEVDRPEDLGSVERAMRRLNRMIKKDGIFKEVMWRRHHRSKREKKPKYFGK